MVWGEQGGVTPLIAALGDINPSDATVDNIYVVYFK